MPPCRSNPRTCPTTPAFLYDRLHALGFWHAHGVMHRDIKPQKNVIDPELHHLCVIDWSLAEFLHPGARYYAPIMTLFNQMLELLLGFHNDDFNFDICAMGRVVVLINDSWVWWMTARIRTTPRWSSKSWPPGKCRVCSLWHSR